MKISQRILYATSSVLALLALTACTDRTDEQRARGDGGTAVISGYYELRSMNPFATTGDLNLAIERYALFTPLVRYDSSMHVVPWLAQSWDTARVSSDTLALTFHLRDDVMWHDGPRVTAYDVAFTYDLARDPRTAYANTQTFALWSPSYEIVDSSTIRFRLRAHPDFLEAWFLTPPLPAHVLRGVAPQEIARAPFGLAPVGSGPFRFVRRNGTNEWVFGANASFPAGLGGPPHLAQLIYHTIPEQTAVITGLLTGSVDFGVSVKPSNVATLEDADGVHVIRHPTPNWIFVALNTRKNFFDSRDERRAISMAVDRRSIVDGILGGHNILGRATVTPVHFAFDSSDATLVPRFDPDSARLLLARAGWRDRDGDGILDDAQGRAFRFKLKAWQSSGAYADIAETMQAQLAKVGIAVDVDIVELNTFSQQMQGTVQRDGSRKRDFDAALGNWTDNMLKDDSQLFHSRWRNGARHWTGYDSPRLDAVMDSLAVTMDAAVSKRLWIEYQRIIVDEAPLLVLYYSIGLAGVRDRLQGVTTDARGPLANVQEWRIAR